MHPPSRFWTYWLLVACVGVILFGLDLVVAPGIARQGFSLLFYANPGAIDAFGPEQSRYISLLYAVLGAVMIGWGVALAYVTKTLFAAGNPIGWNLIALVRRRLVHPRHQLFFALRPLAKRRFEPCFRAAFRGAAVDNPLICDHAITNSPPCMS